MATKPRAESRSFDASSFHILRITAMLKIPREVTKGYIFFVFGFFSPPPTSSFLTLLVCAVTKHLGTPALGPALSWPRKWKTSPPPYSSGSWTQKYLVYAVSWGPQGDWAPVVQVRKKRPKRPLLSLFCGSFPFPSSLAFSLVSNFRVTCSKRPAPTRLPQGWLPKISD